MLITTLVNSAASWSSFTTRSARELKKIELFRLIGKLIRTGRLQRVARKFVTIPATDERYQAYLASATCGIELPKACV